ncbi:ComF family protein [Pseudoxanthomonas indica]|uniref:ComF family protein n=1 Tax=Pseudoxanthomonas indica TaxID=428993 RepID=A0A1T5KRR4_9GAMM|nr:ComF family protein [Pseudoxanthomonas indica]GGD50969.1 amidophosphoribosyltransferase [Pseudoxanthomonas indica]SKC66195.1 comF family protein [Pseudoxanthomonas indica]
MEASKVDGWLRQLGRGLLVARCLICAELGANGLDICVNCRQNLPVNLTACARCALPLPNPGVCGSCQQQVPSLDRCHAAFVYSFPLDRLVPRLKFHRDLAAGRLLADLLTESVASAQLPRPAALVPVPLHAGRLRQRGYDQALELARPLARRLKLSLRADGLRRTRATAAQSELDAGQRQRNLQQAFAAVGPLPAHVALIDDVMTTGATLYAAAAALRRAGVQRVDAWVCARVP